MVPPSVGESVLLRDMLIAWWSAILVVAVGFAVALHFVKPAPPDYVVISAGAEDGAYFAYAKRYREILARHNVVLEVKPSSGAVENYERLRKEGSGIDIGFVQGGIGVADDAPDLRSLGSMYFEPVWIFHRVSGTIDRLTQLEGRRLAIGPEGSGTRRLATALLTANGISVPQGKLSELTGSAAAKALQQGEIDAVLLVAGHQSAAVATLLREPKVRLMSFVQAEGYARNFPFLSAIVLPMGGIDLRQNIPGQDVHLLATTANLVVREELHPAIVGLLAAAGMEVHGAPGLFQDKGQFPFVKGGDFPVSPEAERYYKSGPSFLQRFLPFWAAIFVDRMIVLLVPFFALLIPLARILPALYDWRISSRINRNYGQLRVIEGELDNSAADETSANFSARLDQIEDRVNRLSVPISYNSQLYTLRQHIDMVRSRVKPQATADRDGRPV